MTIQEFSNQFDTLLNSYNKQELFGNLGKETIVLDEYEKSVFLTLALEELILALYGGTDGFEGAEQLRRFTNSLIKTYTTQNYNYNSVHIIPNSTIIELPEDVWFITYEAVSFDSPTEELELNLLYNHTALVYPVTQDDFYKVYKNPFRTVKDTRVLRLDNGKTETETVELISNKDITSYLIRYISKPSPIILVNLSEGLSINNISTKQECILHSGLHNEILNRAVKLAIAAHK